MAMNVVLFTDRPGFEPLWRPACEHAGLGASTLSPDRLPASVGHGDALVIDAESNAYDEDELLACLGLAVAVGATPAVHLPADESMSGAEDVIDELCNGRVARDAEDIARVVALLARRLDPERSRRFEFVTVSPKGGSLLAILGDSRAVLVDRPIGEDDDGSEVTTIELAEDAQSAALTLSNGGTLTLHVDRIARKPAKTSNGSSNGIPIDGARLGARLRELRLAAGLTQAELARRTGIHRPNIARVEAGRHTPSLETLARLATAIGVPTTRVLSED